MANDLLRSLHEERAVRGWLSSSRGMAGLEVGGGEVWGSLASDLLDQVCASPEFCPGRGHSAEASRAVLAQWARAKHALVELALDEQGQDQGRVAEAAEAEDAPPPWAQEAAPTARRPQRRQRALGQSVRCALRHRRHPRR